MYQGPNYRDYYYYINFSEVNIKVWSNFRQTTNEILKQLKKLLLLLLFLAALGLCCGVWNFFSCRVGGFSSFGAWALMCVGPLVVAHGFSCHSACRILVFRGIEPASPALEGRFLTTGWWGKSQEWDFKT